jgi:hypothetical protein
MQNTTQTYSGGSKGTLLCQNRNAERLQGTPCPYQNDNCREKLVIEKLIKTLQDWIDGCMENVRDIPDATWYGIQANAYHDVLRRLRIYMDEK